MNQTLLRSNTNAIVWTELEKRIIPEIQANLK
jgi:hypothetical protein